MSVLALTHRDPLQIENVHDDLKRETAFYKQALCIAAEAKKLVLEKGKIFSKPETLFCEMIKSETHMEKIKKSKEEAADRVKRSEDAKKQRALKKFGKQVQVEKMLEKQKQKSKETAKAELYKKKHVIDNMELDDDFEVQVDENGGPYKPKTGGNKQQLNKKRMSKNKKYGFGGKKKFSKSNTKESINDFSGYKQPRKGITKKRPGKSKRQNMKSNKK